LLLAGLFSGLARINTPATRSFTHAITFGVDLAVFTNIVQYAYAKTLKTRKDKQPFCRKWGPFNCLLAATILTMADLARHLVNDAWGTACTSTDSGDTLAICKAGQTESCNGVPLPSKYDKYCYSRNVANEFLPGYEGFPHLTVYGWVFTIFCTYSGFILLFIGIFWLINFPAKMRAQWRTLRAGRSRTSARAIEPEVEPSAQARSRPLVERG